MRHGLHLCQIGFLLLVAVAHGQSVTADPWDEGLTAYQRFLIYPHMEKGFRSSQQDKSQDALDAFRQAHALAPGQPVISLYLAEAYIRLRQYSQAIQTLEEQLASTPNRPALVRALENARNGQLSASLEKGQGLVGNKSELREFIKNESPRVDNPYAESAWLELLGKASTAKENFLRLYQPRFQANRLQKAKLELILLAASGDGSAVRQYIDELPESVTSDSLTVEELSYKLIGQKYPREAIELLLKSYPFTNATPSLRATLSNRLFDTVSEIHDQSPLVSYLSSQPPTNDTPDEERAWLQLIIVAASSRPEFLLSYHAKFPANQAFQAKTIWDRFAANDPNFTATVIARSLPRKSALDPDKLDILTYKLVEEGKVSEATGLLMARYPFANYPVALRSRLIGRLNTLVASRPQSVSSDQMAKLAIPLDTPVLRGQQSALLSASGNCPGVEAVLGDFSNDYQAEDWLRLGNCFQGSAPGLAQYAFDQAYRRRPSADTARALAYQAVAAKDSESAIKYWRIVIESNASGPADLIAAASAAAMAKDLTSARRWLEQYQRQGENQDDRYWSLKAATESNSKPELAQQAIRRAIELRPTAEYYATLANLQLKRGETDQAIQSFLKALSLSPEDSSLMTSLGFAYYLSNDMPRAEFFMRKAYAMRPDDSKLVEQLAYVNQRLGSNAKALHFSELAIDQDNRLPPGKVTPEVVDQQYGLRRMHEDLSRRWTFTFDAISGSQPAAIVSAPQPGISYKSYAQAEVSYRLGNPAIDDGKTLSAYSRVFAGGGATKSALPIYAPYLAAGLRWKPFADQVINFAMEEQAPLDNSQNSSFNTMARVSASFFNTGKTSDDWHPTGPGWMAQNLYLDGAYYLNLQQYALTADYRVSYHAKLTEGQTIEPYSHLQYNGISQASGSDVRVALGVRWNRWGNETRYDAYADKISLGIEYQYALATYLTDKSTILMTLGTRW